MRKHRNGLRRRKHSTAGYEQGSQSCTVFTGDGTEMIGHGPHREGSGDNANPGETMEKKHYPTSAARKRTRQNQEKTYG